MPSQDLATNPASVYALLIAPAPTFSDDAASRIAEEVFGVCGSVEALHSERDQNFLLRAADGSRFVLKIGNSAEESATTDFHTRAILHAARQDPELPLPEVIRTRDNAVFGRTGGDGNTQHQVRLLSYVPGVPSDSASSGTALCHALGVSTARLGRALRGFVHPAAGFSLAWDLKQAPLLRELPAHVDDRDDRALLLQVLDDFDRWVAPSLGALRAQVIHGDTNPGNLLVDPAQPERVTGIIDFGDMVHSPLICDLAVACAYRVGDDDEPLAPVLDTVAAYSSITPLERTEIDVLFDLIRTRLAMTVTISTWRARRFPENRDYILTSNAKARRALMNLNALSRTTAQKRLRTLVPITPDA